MEYHQGNPDMLTSATHPAGIRKLRFSKKARSKGKSGAYRVYYAMIPEYGTVLLMAIVSKSDQSDLSRADLIAIGQFVDRIKQSLDKGAIQ